jgi:hypothetical protein
MFGAENEMKRSKVFRLCALIVGIGAMTLLTAQDVRTFLTEDNGPEYFRSNPVMILVCLAIGTVVGLSVHFVLEWSTKTKTKPNQASDATSEPAPSAASSSHQR